MASICTLSGRQVALTARRGVCHSMRVRLVARLPVARMRMSVSASLFSVDPLANRQNYEPGFTMPVHSEEQLNKFLAGSFKDKLVVVMCKSSHCKPCKAFLSKYIALADRFADCVLLEMTGDESPELRKLMKDWQVKVTPTFRMYRGGEFMEAITGTGDNKLLNAILGKLQDGERGRDWTEVTHEDVEL